MPEYDIALELARLHILKGADFIRQLKMLTGLPVFKCLDKANPNKVRTADFIFERKGIFKMYDLKTIQGHSSAFNRLIESIGQVNHVLLNITTDYDTRLLASDIKSYFEINSDALEVLIFKGKKQITIDRDFTQSPQYHRLFRKRYEK